MSMDWYYLSFANPEFKGAIVVLGRSIEDAHNRAVWLGADKDWHVAGVNITAIDGPVPNPSYRYRLLSRYDVEHMHDDQEGVEKGAVGFSICTECSNANPIADLTGKLC